MAGIEVEAYGGALNGETLVIEGFRLKHAVVGPDGVTYVESYEMEKDRLGFWLSFKGAEPIGRQGPT